MRILSVELYLISFIFGLSFGSCQIFVPDFYQISLDFSNFTSSNKVFDGETSISFKVSQEVYGVQEIELDAELLNFNNISIWDSSNNQIDVIKSGYKGLKYIITFKLDNAVNELELILKYKGAVGKAGDTGVFITKENNIVATNSYPEGVRKIFPCINDPSIRTSFKLDVTLINHEWGIHQITDDLESPFLPAYAVGFIMTLHYRKVDDISTDKFYVWVPSYNQPLYDSVNSNPILKDVLAKGTYFYEFFGPAYLDKIHIVMVPGIQPLSLINHRLISLRSDVMLSVDVETAEMAKATAVATINAISKHFFRCVVTPKTWEDFWLSDSLALYLQYALLNNNMFEGMNFPDLFTAELQRPAMRGASLAVNPKYITPSALATAAIFPPAYQGAAVLKMLEPLSSQVDIMKDLMNYFNKYLYRSVDTNEFLDFMSNGSMYRALNTYGKRLGPILDKWIHDIGYPYLTDLSITNAGFSIEQETFYGSNSTSKWIIPFVYYDGSDENGTLEWMTGNQNSIFSSKNVGSWIQLNKQSKGLFRVNYGKTLGDLSKDKVYWQLSGSDREALVDDSFLLAWRTTPIVDFASVLNLFDKLINETEYTPFELSMNHINTLRHLYSQRGIANQFDLKIGDLVQEMYSSVDWYKPDKVDIGKAMWARTVVQTACDFATTSCQLDAKDHSADQNSVLNDLLPTVKCIEVRNSMQTKWNDSFVHYYNKMDTQYVRADALYSLACPINLGKNGSIAIGLYLETINSDEILAEDAQRAFTYIYSRPEHVNQTMKYIKDNYFTLMARFGDDFMSELITDISKLLLTSYYYNVLETIKGYSLNNSKTLQAVVESQAEMKIRFPIVNANLPKIMEWIKSNSTIPTTPTPNQTTKSHKSSAADIKSNMLFKFLSLTSLYNIYRHIN